MIPKQNPEKQSILECIAYRIYQARVREGIGGTSLSDWLEAEREYKERFE